MLNEDADHRKHFTKILTSDIFVPQVHPKDLNNGVINACFLLLFKDLIKLYACYNDGIINLLGKESPLNFTFMSWYLRHCLDGWADGFRF